VGYAYAMRRGVNDLARAEFHHRLSHPCAPGSVQAGTKIAFSPHFGSCASTFTQQHRREQARIINLTQEGKPSVFHPGSDVRD
jgi:hypothetical protein